MDRYIILCITLSKVLWYRDTLRLDTTERAIMETRGSRHTLILRKVQASDFGNYSCVADNALGKTRQYVELSGKPNPAVFSSHPLGRYRDSYNLSWAVNSYTPIEEFKLSFRKLPNSPHGEKLQAHPKRPSRRDNETYVYMGYGSVRSDWSDVILSTTPSEQFRQQMSYLIRGLEPAAQYEATVQARNRFGWNQVSERFQFSTRGSEMPPFEPSPEPAVFAEPEVRDMEVIAQSTGDGSTLAVSPLVGMAALFLLVTCS